MVLDKKVKIGLVASVILIAIIGLQYVSYRAEKDASQLCEKAYVLQDKKKILEIIPDDIKSSKKNASISSRSIIIRFHTLFMTRYECSILFNENDKVISSSVFYSD